MVVHKSKKKKKKTIHFILSRSAFFSFGKLPQPASASCNLIIMFGKSYSRGIRKDRIILVVFALCLCVWISNIVLGRYFSGGKLRSYRIRTLLFLG